MSWSLNEAIEYYGKSGAPGDQNALINLLKEIQQEQGRITYTDLHAIVTAYGIKESILHALIRRVPRLRLEDRNCLEICSGKNCGKSRELEVTADKLMAEGRNFELRFVPCMRQCSKGPNLKWNGKLYNRADRALLEKLTGE